MFNFERSLHTSVNIISKFREEDIFQIPGGRQGIQSSSNYPYWIFFFKSNQYGKYRHNSLTLNISKHAPVHCIYHHYFSILLVTIPFMKYLFIYKIIRNNIATIIFMDLSNSF